MREAFAVREGFQWDIDEYDRVKSEGLTPYTLNLVDPICNAIIGFQVQNRSEASYIPRLLGENRQKSAVCADMVDNGVNYIEDCSQAEYHDSHSFSDMVTCGVGATDAIIDYAEYEFGHPRDERIYPGFLLWDTSARGKNFLDANWVARAKVVFAETLEDEEDEEGESSALAGSGFDDSYFIEQVSNEREGKTLAVVYDYQWRQKEPVYLIKNPFTPESAYANDRLILTWLGEATKRLGFDVLGGVLSISKQNIAAWREETKALGIKHEKPVIQKVWRYYRATIWGGKVRSKALNFCQKGFSIKFMTGKFSERDQAPYGVVADLIQPQRLLNQCVTDLAGWARSNPMGGVIIEDDAVSNLKDFIKTFRKGRDVTVVKSGTIAGQKIEMKQATPFPVGQQQMAQFYADMMLRVAGVTPEFMGQMDTKDMTGVLHAQIVRQGLTVLAPFFDAMRFYIEEKGEVRIDQLRVLAENYPMRPIRNITGVTKDQDYLPLLEDYIAAEYDIEIIAAPLTPTQAQETFDKMMQFSMESAQVNPALSSATMGVALEYAPIREEEKEQIRQAATPQPTPPDPLNVMLIEAEAKAKIAEAQEREASSVLKQAQAVKAIADAGKPADTKLPDPQIDPIAASEHQHAIDMDTRKAALEREKAEAEMERVAGEDEYRREELELRKKELELKEKELEQKAELAKADRESKEKDREHSGNLEREKMRMSNPEAAEALDMLEGKRQAAEKESEARIKALLDASEKQTQAVLKAVDKLVKGGDKKDSELAKAITTLGKGMEQLAAGQIIAMQSGKRVEEGVSQLAESVEALSRPRKKTVEFVRADDGRIESAEVMETVQ